MTTDTLSRLISTAVDIGNQAFLERQKPEKAWMSRPKVLAMLKLHGLKPSDLLMWETEGRVHGVKHGERRATTYPSKKIMELILQGELRSKINVI